LKPFTQLGQEKNEKLTFFQRQFLHTRIQTKSLLGHGNDQTKKDLPNRKDLKKRNGIKHSKALKKSISPVKSSVCVEGGRRQSHKEKGFFLIACRSCSVIEKGKRRHDRVTMGGCVDGGAGEGRYVAL